MSIRKTLIAAGLAPQVVDMVEEFRDVLHAHADAKSYHPINVAQAMIVGGIVLLRNNTTDEDFSSFIHFVFGMTADPGIDVRLPGAFGPSGDPPS